MLPVAIVGGGPVGLVSSILLSMRQIPHRVFEQFPGTSIHPKACGLNQRTVEIFRHTGIEEDIKLHRAPLDVVGRSGWFSGVGPTSRKILSRDAWGGGSYQQEYSKASPVQYSTLAQIRLEPILLRRAVQLNPDGVESLRASALGLGRIVCWVRVEGEEKESGPRASRPEARASTVAIPRHYQLPGL